MNSLNESIENIRVEEIIIVLITLVAIVIGFNIDTDWIYVGIIAYFIIKLRKCDFKTSISNVFLKISPKFIILIVLVNIFFSYGMLYLTDYITLLKSALTINILSTVIIAPVSEELLFRGILLNKLKSVVPVSFAILISSLIFGLLHSFGSIISASIFGVCMGIIYVKSKNILTPIFAHFLNNLIAEILVLIDSTGLIFSNMNVKLIISLLAIISLFLIMVSIKAEWGNINNK